MSTAIFNKTAGDLIRDALRFSTISGIELPIQPNHFAQASSQLNNILANLQTKQIHLWSETEAVMPLNPNQADYTIGAAHIFTDYVYTTLTTAAATTAISLTVGSTSGMSAGDFIGILLSDGARQWTTIDTVTSTTSLDLVDALTGDADVTAGIYAYTTKIDTPVRILDMRHGDTHTSDEIPAWQVSRQEYYNQPSKLATGSVNTWYYSRQLSNSKLSVWPVATTARQVVRFTFIKPQYIPEDQSDDILIPPEWYNALTWQLAGDLGVMYNIDTNKQVVIEQKAQNYMADALSTDTDFSSIQFCPR